MKEIIHSSSIRSTEDLIKYIVQKNSRFFEISKIEYNCNSISLSQIENTCNWLETYLIPNNSWKVEGPLPFWRMLIHPDIRTAHIALSAELLGLKYEIQEAEKAVYGGFTKRIKIYGTFSFNILKTNGFPAKERKKLPLNFRSYSRGGGYDF